MAADTACSYPWSHFIWRDERTAIPCCNYSGEGQALDPGTKPGDVLASPLFTRIRDEMSRGERPAGCSRCYRQEEASRSSMRLNANRDFPVQPGASPRLRFLELHLGNLCNLKCRGCGSRFSTKWAADEIRLGIQPAPPFRASLSAALDGAWEGLERVKLIGGEPLLSPEHDEFLRLAGEKGLLPRLTLEYATNATVRPSPEVLRAWEKLAGLEINFSVDGLREKNDFFRDGSRWKEVTENIHWFRRNVRSSRVELCIHTVVNIYNAREIPELDDWLLSEFPDLWLTKDCLIQPAWLSIANFPEEEKDRLRRLYAEKSTVFRRDRRRSVPYRKILGFLDTPATAPFSAFLEMDRRLNDIRGHTGEIPSLFRPASPPP